MTAVLKLVRLAAMHPAEFAALEPLREAIQEMHGDDIEAGSAAFLAFRGRFLGGLRPSPSEQRGAR